MGSHKFWFVVMLLCVGVNAFNFFEFKSMGESDWMWISLFWMVFCGAVAVYRYRRIGDVDGE